MGISRTERPQRPTVLIVEDEALIAMDLAASLGAMGFAVMRASSLAGALQALGDAPPDLAIIDILLGPRPEGLELAAAIRERFGDATAIVFLSGYSDTEMMARAQACAPLGVLTKPYVPEDLHALARQVLDRGG